MLKVLVITQGVNPIVRYLNESHYELVGVIEDAPRAYMPSRVNRVKKAIQRILPCLFKGSLTSFCKTNGLNYHLYHKNNHNFIRDEIRRLKPNLIVVFSMSKLLKKEIFEIPKYGTMNLHPSYLPEYPGRNPIFWTYLNMELNPGVTLHFIDEGEDTGNIISQKRFSFPIGATYSEFVKQAIGTVGKELINDALKALSEEGSIDSYKQSADKKFPKARQPKPDESLINWEEKEGREIWHLLRGTAHWYCPIEAPQALYKGQTWQILDFEEKGTEPSSYGTVLQNGSMGRLFVKGGIIHLKSTFRLRPMLKRIIND